MFMVLLSSWPRFPSYSPELHASAQLPGEDCRLPGPQCGGTRAAVHGIQRHPAFSAGRTQTGLMARFLRISQNCFLGLHVQEPTCTAHLLIIPTSGIIMPYMFFPEPFAGDVHPAAGEEATGALEHRWRDRRYERGPGSTCEGQSKCCSTDPFKLDRLGTKSVSFSLFTAANNSFCRTCCWLVFSPFVLGEFPLIIRCFQ